MNRFGFFGVLIVVVVVHFIVLQSQIAKKSVVAKPKAKVHHITLSKISVKKPQSKLIKKPKQKPKPKPKKVPNKIKKPKKTETKKPKKSVVVPKQPVPKPIVKTVITPVATIDTASIKDRYTSEIRREIEQNLIYPNLAKRLRMQGIVKIKFRVLKNGTITTIKTLNTPKRLLEKGAIKTLNSISLKPIPSELNEQFLDIVIPIEFKLKG